MRTQPAMRFAAGMAAAIALFGCHAHGDQAVSTIDHQITVAFFRHATHPSTATVKFSNGSAQAVCLGSAAFNPASFSVKTDKGLAQSVAPAAPTTPDCDPLAAGAVKQVSMDAGLGLSRYELQAGRMCYNYILSSAPGSTPAWRSSGAICE